ncbi:MAG TPA: hypothetical protein VMA98_06415 [Candidatus Acidoferrales bacterium]|nr:hypothetical protein [Candidatus Acidoferrales bacterium]
MRQIAVALLACALLLGAAPPAAPKAFKILGASVDVNVARGGITLPATQVPYLEPGDVIEISFPRGVQFSRSPRWHLVVADMYDDYLQHAPSFPIADADLSRAKPGYVWKITVAADATPLIFLVPESGDRYGHGIPQARDAISQLQNRSLLLRTASLSASAQAKASTLHAFLTSLSSIQPGQLADGRARVAAATQSLFGSNLGGEACFATSVAQSTQYACAAQAVAAGYESAPKTSVVAAVGGSISVGAATYGMLIGTIYALLAKRRVSAHYIFEPGVITPGAKTTGVQVSEQPEYDASAAKPSTIVYFTIGSRATSPKAPVYGPAPSLPVCLSDSSLELTMPFSALPIYFRSHEVTFTASGTSFTVPASYDVLRGYGVQLTSGEVAGLKAGGSARITSVWGFDRVTSPPIALIEPRAARWTLAPGTATIVAGAKSARLRFDDGGAGMGSCVASVDVTDGLGHTLDVSELDRTADSVSATIDASQAGGAGGAAVLTEEAMHPQAALPFAILPPMPTVTSAIAYLPRGVLVLRGTGLKYIASVTLEHTGIVFDQGTPDTDGSWSFTASAQPAPYQPAWEHETLVISYTLVPPDTRTASVEADVEYAPATPAASPSPSASRRRLRRS